MGTTNLGICQNGEIMRTQRILFSFEYHFSAGRAKSAYSVRMSLGGVQQSQSTEVDDEAMAKAILAVLINWLLAREA